MPAPELSVVMPVYNAAPFLDEAIDSIVRQSFRDFEFIIRDDGSTDGSNRILRQWAARDRRIILIEGEQLGPVGSSNAVVATTRSNFIARMDADDVAYRDRLHRQLAMLSEHPEVVLLGTMFDTIDRAGRPLRPYDYSRLAKGGHAAPFPHPSIMFRKDVFDRIGGYRQECAFWEDLDLYLRMAEAGQLAVLSETLMAYRAHSSTRLTLRRDAVERSLSLRYRCMEAYSRGENYEALLCEPNHSAQGKLHPKLFVALGAMELWSGGTPKMAAEIAQRGDLKCDLASFRCLVWAAWASLSPASLRWAVIGIIRLRNLAFSRRIRTGLLYRWDPRARATPTRTTTAETVRNSAVESLG